MRARVVSGNAQFSVSDNGVLLLYMWVVSLDDVHTRRALLADPKLFQTEAVFSPDGRWPADAVSDKNSFARQIFVRPYPGLNGMYQITTEGGADPVWSANGKQLFYVRNSMPSSVGQNSTLDRTIWNGVRPDPIRVAVRRHARDHI